MIRIPQIDLILIVILIIGFALRLVGIGVGLPDYPDARESLIAQDIVNLMALKAPPENYNWPGAAWFYLVAAVGKILTFFGFDATVSRVIWLARFVNTLLSTATLWATYQIGLRFYQRPAALASAALLAVSMLHATNESRFALVDIPAAFCVTLVLWLCAKGSPISLRRATFISVVAGVGFAVKYTTAFVGLSVIAALFIERERGWRYFLLNLATVIGVGGVAFTILCPYWLIDLLSPEWNQFFDAFFYEFSHYHRGHFGVFATGEINWMNRYTYLWTLLRWGMGPPLALLSIVAVVFGLFKRQDGDKILLAFVIPYLFFVGSHKLKFARHLLLIYPALALLGAASITRFSGRWKQAAIAVGGMVWVYSFVYTAAFAGVMTRPPTMTQAAEWIEANIPPNETIEREPEVLFDWLSPRLNREYEESRSEWAIVLTPNAEVFLNYAEAPESYSAIDWYPLEGVDTDKALAFYERVFGTYKLARVFKQEPAFLGVSVSARNAPFPMRALSHPEIRIYRSGG